MAMLHNACHYSLTAKCIIKEERAAIKAHDL